MNKYLKYAILLVCMLSMVACLSSATQSIPIPDRELVFVRWESKESSWDSTLEQLGFVNADGSDLEIVEANTVIGKPVWSADGMFLYGLSLHTAGYPAYWDKSKASYGLCDEDLPYFFQIEGTNNKENPYEVLVNNVWTIILLDLAECREKQRLVDYEAPPENKNYDIEGFSYYSPTQELVFGLVVNPYGDRQYRIMHLDVKSGQQQQLAGEGINPTWSPDGTHIAYIRWDGIYIALSDGSDAKKLVAQQMFDPNEAGTPWINSPIPRWSSDSEWLVYHLCTVKICKLENTEIYKIRVSGGEPERILIGGMDPSWRP